MKNLKKYSFTIIELIFAIVVIGIVSTSIPMLLTTSTNIQETNMKEKSFFNAYSTLNLIQVQAWDENNTQEGKYKTILTADNGDSELLCQRKGIQQLNRNLGAVCATEDNKTSTIGPDKDENSSEDYDDMDDFNDYSTEVGDFNISVNVKYISDTSDYSQKNIYIDMTDESSQSDTNIKLVKVNVSDKNTKELISVISYIAPNIGASKIKSEFK